MFDYDMMICSSAPFHNHYIMTGILVALILLLIAVITVTQSHYANTSLYDPGTQHPPGMPTKDPWGQTFVFVKGIFVSSTGSTYTYEIIRSVAGRPSGRLDLHVHCSAIHIL